MIRSKLKSDKKTDSESLRIKRGDLIVIAVLILLSLLPLILFADEAYSGEDRYAIIYSNGKKYAEIKLGDDLYREYDIIDADSHNLVVISGYEVYIKEADCRDQVCVKQGVIFKAGQTIVCLPNRVFIEITGKGTSEIDDISR